VFKIDDIEFTKGVLSKPKRSFQVLDGENAGRVLTGDAERDVIGTYYNYSTTVDSSFMTLEEYDELYEIISAPVSFHTLIVPYGQSTYEYQAYITNGTDELNLIKDGKNYWGNLTFNFIAKSPKRRPS
jgi:hypothetical protein